MLATCFLTIYVDPYFPLKFNFLKLLFVYFLWSTVVPYRRKFSWHEKFVKSLKTGFSCLFIRKTIPDIRESHAYINIV